MTLLSCGCRMLLSLQLCVDTTYCCARFMKFGTSPTIVRIKLLMSVYRFGSMFCLQQLLYPKWKCYKKRISRDLFGHHERRDDRLTRRPKWKSYRHTTSLLKTACLPRLPPSQNFFVIVMTIVVHHLDKSRSHRILWLLEELGVPYELKEYKRDRETMLAPPELKKVHPLGKSPVIENTETKEVIAESGAIVEVSFPETFPVME